MWDVASHILNRPETFFTPCHLVLYAGVALGLAAGGLGLLLRLGFLARDPPDRSLLRGFGFAAFGSGLQLVAGPSRTRAVSGGRRSAARTGS